MVGETLQSYKVIKKIAEGGMGVVYLAKHVLIGCNAAIKVLLPEYTSNREVVERFFTEARAAAMVKHRGIIDIFDFGYAANGSAYIIMEYLEGEDLAERMASVGRLTLAETLVFARQIAGALQVAHEAGVIHRDLKPENVFITPDLDVPGGERTKLLDFGIAKLTAPEANTRKTSAGAVMGSPAYMSPEQCRGSQDGIDGRSDIYSLGCVMFQMLCGRAPFAGEGPGDILAKQIHEQPVEPRSLNPAIPQSLQAIILCCLAKEPEKRFKNAAFLMRALEAAGAHRMATHPGVKIDNSEQALPAQPDPTSASDEWSLARTDTTLGTANGQMNEAPLPKPTSRLAWTAGIGGGLAIAAVAVLLLAGPDNDNVKPKPLVADVARAIVPAAAPKLEEKIAKPAVLPSTIQVTVRTDPAGAAVYRALDGVKLGTTPFVTQLARADGELKLLLRLDGHLHEKLVVPLSEDQERLVKLTKRRKKSPPRNKRGWGSTINPLGD